MYPVLLFTYKRLQTLKNTVSFLSLNPEAIETDLIIFSDGPKSAEDETLVFQVREYIFTIKGFKSVKISLSDSNKGLANSIISGVSTVLSQSEAVIVLEDDLEVSTDFLFFMNSCLEKYKYSTKVFSISGFSLPFKHAKNFNSDIYFLKRASSWGWATWRDRWEDIDWDVKDYQSFVSNKALVKQFALRGSDVNDMLAKKMDGSLDSWAIVWTYHQFKVGSLTVFPLYSKVINKGFDEFATHTKGSYKRYASSRIHHVNTKRTLQLPEIIATNPYYTRQFLNKMSLLARIKSKLGSIFKLIFGREIYF
jgi:hypothetical protein